MVTFELMDRTFYSGLFLIVLLSILTPGFFYQTRVINHVKKSINEKALGVLGALITMMLILYTHTSGVDSKILFVAALLSAFVGLIISQASLLSKYWRFLIRSGVN
ncbi:MAG: hypothetical protein D8M62_01435 [Proteobacteria bacterium]|nr:hypothetical protein [Pseudomonadota bacterium]